ncbi:MAG TPA: PfkB family carbohydrate kinase [Actinomycetota bacterium]|nr:PfkB family carbohydrate kinase [Actinomycetota bacterium]
MPRVAVVGHIEWITFARVDRVPAAGGIAHATETWSGAGGGGGVAAQQLAKLDGSCELFTALGEDEIGDRAAQELAAVGVRVYAAPRTSPTRQAVCLVDRDGERTITTLGPRSEASGSDPLPWDRLAEVDAAYVTAGDADALRRVRAAHLVVVSSRHLRVLAASGIRADVVVGSAVDRHEIYDPELLAHAPPELVVLTEGAAGGRFQTAEGETGRWRPTPPPGPISDTYGSGDSFQAGLTWALGGGLPLGEALDLAARCGAAALTGHGPAGGQLSAANL